MIKKYLLLAFLLLPACKSGSSLISEEKIEYSLGGSKENTTPTCSNVSSDDNSINNAQVQFADEQPKLVITRKFSNENHSDTGNPSNMTIPQISVTPIPVNINGETYVGFSIDTDNGNLIGGSLSTVEITSKLLKTPMIIGAIVFLGGIAAIIWLPIKKYGFMVAAAGLGLIAFSYLLSTYATYILIFGGILALAALAYVVYQFKVRDDAAKQFVLDIQSLKNRSTKFTHNPKIRKFVDQTKRKMKLDNLL